MRRSLFFFLFGIATIAIGILIVAWFDFTAGFNATKIDCKNVNYSKNQTLNLEIMKYCIGVGGEGQ